MPLSRMAISRRALLAAAGAVAVGACAGVRQRSSAQRDTRSTTTVPTSSSTAPPAAVALPGFVRTGRPGTAAVAFTFHGSGDVALLDDLLRAAADARVPITVFAVGQWLDANPAVARRILDGGHELANHTYTHPVLTRLAANDALAEISRCRDALARHTGAPGRWFRPSGTPTPTATISDAARRAGYATIVGYDVDPRDYQDPGASVIVDRVAAGMRAGSIVSLHTGHAGTVAAFAPMITAARARGLEPVTVSRLLGVPA